jgi:tellurite resistance protein
MAPKQETNGLKTFVHVRNPETSQYEAFGPDDELPDWFKDAAEPGVFETSEAPKQKKAAPKTPTPPEPAESVKALRARIANVDDLEALQGELDGEERESAKKALQSRIKAVTEDQLEAGTYVFPTVESIDEHVATIDDVERLSAFRAAEEAGPNRSTAIAVFDKAITVASGDGTNE